MTTPDKPFGATDSIDSMYSPDEVVINLEDSDVDSSLCNNLLSLGLNILMHLIMFTLTFLPTKDVVKKLCLY